MSDQQYGGASAEAIQHHYDLSNDFYALWLDETRTYSCAIWEPGDDLETAQLRKLDYLAAGANVGQAAKVLDVGCGWGSMARRMLEEHGAKEVVGLTLSDAQADYVRDFGDDRIEVRVEGWADHAPDAQYDAIVSIGAFEHFAGYGLTREERVAAYRAFFRQCYQWLPRGGRLALQTNVKGSNIRLDRQMLKDFQFVIDHIFRESELPWTSELLEATERRFNIVSLRNDPEHYSRTCGAWYDNLVARREEALELVSPESLRDYERYLKGCTLAFDRGHLGLVRVVLERV